MNSTLSQLLLTEKFGQCLQINISDIAWYFEYITNWNILINKFLNLLQISIKS